MRRQFLAAATAASALLLAAACATTPAPGADEPSTAEVVRNGDDWTVTYQLNRDAPVWVMRRSADRRSDEKPWRPDQWTIETPGVRLERRGEHDVIYTPDGSPVPRTLRVRLRPASVNLLADYDPALAFSDGRLALYSGHFDLFPVADMAAAEALPADLNDASLPDESVRVGMVDRGGSVLFRGEVTNRAIIEGPSAYVLFGAADVVGNDAVALVVDPGLPSWVAHELDDFTPKALAYYTQRLGPAVSGRPAIMAAWRGPTPQLRSMGGSVLSGFVAMSFEGVGVVEPSDEVADHTRWFIGHEAAHFWLGQTVRYERRRDAWITEGGADLMAVRALQAINPAYDARAVLQEEVDDCVKLAVRPVAEAAERNEHRANYACGAVFALAAEAAERRARGGDWLDVLKPLIDANREDGVLTRDEWLTHLTAISGDPAPRADIERLLDQGDADPAGVIARLFTQTGVAFTRGEDGAIRLL